MYSLQQVSVFYLFIIALLGWLGYTGNSSIVQTFGVQMCPATTSAIGAIIGVLISHQMFMYARREQLVQV